MYRRITLLLILFCLPGFGVHGQARWIADGIFADTPAVGLYDLCNRGKPLVLAVGNIHSQATARLLDSYLLQKLDSDHGQGSPYATKELQVAFLNVRVFPDEPLLRTYEGISVHHIDEWDEVLSRPGWKELYSIHTTGLFLITPDRLVYKLEAGNAAELYRIAKSSCSRLKPLDVPDARLVHAGLDEGGAHISVEVQNFSRVPLNTLQVVVRNSHAELARISYKGIISPMEAAMVHVPVPGGIGTEALEIAAVTERDGNPLNNTWTGRLLPDGAQPVAAATMTR